MAKPSPQNPPPAGPQLSVKPNAAVPIRIVYQDDNVFVVCKHPNRRPEPPRLWFAEFIFHTVKRIVRCEAFDAIILSPLSDDEPSPLGLQGVRSALQLLFGRHRFTNEFR